MNENKKPKERRIKVEEVGDFWNDDTYSRIRMQGKWLVEAGIHPNSYVRILNPQPGMLVFHAVELDE